MKKKNNIERKVYFNGKFIPESEAKISIYDSSLMFGDMVFEMTRSFNKKQFKLREHLERLFLGLKILHIHIDLKIDDLESICHETIEINEKVFWPMENPGWTSAAVILAYDALKNFSKGSKIFLDDHLI